MIRLSRKLYNEIYSDNNSIKAIAMLIFIKNKFRSSVVTKWSYSKLAEVTGLSRNTCKKRLGILSNMGLIKYIGKNNRDMIFGCVKSQSRRSNIRIGNFKGLSINNTEKALKLLFVAEVQSHKDFIIHQVIKLNSEDANITKEEVKYIKRWAMEHGMVDRETLKINKEFEDKGISYKYICSKLHISYSTWSYMIKLAERINVFSCKNQVTIEKASRYADLDLKYRKQSDKKYNHSYVSNGYIITKGANLYSLINI